MVFDTGPRLRDSVNFGGVYAATVRKIQELDIRTWRYHWLESCQS